MREIICKKCELKEKHYKAGRSNNRQIWRCSNCGARQTEPSASGKKKSNTFTVAARLNKEDLEALNKLPGKNNSEKIRFALKNCSIS